MKGDLLAQQWNGETYRLSLSSDGRSVVTFTTLTTPLASLDFITAPGGARTAPIIWGEAGDRDALFGGAAPHRFRLIPGEHGPPAARRLSSVAWLSGRRLAR